MCLVGVRENGAWIIHDAERRHDSSNDHGMIVRSQVVRRRARHGEIKWLWDLIAIVIVMFVRIVETPGFF